MRKSRPLWEGRGSETARHLRTCLQATGPEGCLCCGSQDAAPEVGAASPTLHPGGKHFNSRGGGKGDGEAGSHVLPSPPPRPRSARARGNSRAAATARRLSYSASSWTRRQTAKLGDYARPGNARPGLLLWGGGVPALEAVSSSCGVPRGGQESRGP